MKKCALTHNFTHCGSKITLGGQLEVNKVVLNCISIFEHLFPHQLFTFGYFDDKLSTSTWLVGEFGSEIGESGSGLVRLGRW